MSAHRCPQCGLELDTISPKDGEAAARSYPRRYRAALATLDDADDPEGLLRRRPAPDVWSALEYTAHVAALAPWFAEAIRRTAYENHPTIDAAGAESVVERERYNELPKDVVLERLAAGENQLADAIRDVPADGWKRTATYPWGERDALTMMRNAIHEGHHHLRDVERVLDQVKRQG